MGTAIKHPVLDHVKPSFVIFIILALWAQGWASECLDVKMTNNPVWHRMLYSCTHMTTVGVKGLTCSRCDDTSYLPKIHNCGLSLLSVASVHYYYWLDIGNGDLI